MKECIVSVVVVCFNERKRIEKTLDSILGQSCKRIECIIVDGGSWDGTLEIIDSYKGRFQVSGIEMHVISGKDQGIYDAMNKGTGKANGKWILFLNTGDRFHEKDAVEKVISKVQDGDDIIIGKIVFFDGFLGKTIEHSPLGDLKRSMIFCHQAILARKELLEEHCFDIRYKYCADYEWLLTMYLAKKRIHCIDAVIADYDGDGISSKNAEASRAEMKQIQEKYGLLNDERNVRQINWKYRLYKKAGKYKVLSLLFYYLYGKKSSYYLRVE